jgi:hypothetical protein
LSSMTKALTYSAPPSIKPLTFWIEISSSLVPVTSRVGLAHSSEMGMYDPAEYAEK